MLSQASCANTCGAGYACCAALGNRCIAVGDKCAARPANYKPHLLSGINLTKTGGKRSLCIPHSKTGCYRFAVGTGGPSSASFWKIVDSQGSVLTQGGSPATKQVCLSTPATQKSALLSLKSLVASWPVSNFLRVNTDSACCKTRARTAEPHCGSHCRPRTATPPLLIALSPRTA